MLAGTGFPELISIQFVLIPARLIARIKIIVKMFLILVWVLVSVYFLVLFRQNYFPDNSIHIRLDPAIIDAWFHIAAFEYQIVFPCLKHAILLHHPDDPPMGIGKDYLRG